MVAVDFNANNFTADFCLAAIQHQTGTVFTHREPLKAEDGNCLYLASENLRKASIAQKVFHKWNANTYCPSQPSSSVY